jgi:hypothetical protein
MYSFPCPPGTYGDGIGYKNIFQILDSNGDVMVPGCVPCPPTQYCPNMGMGSSPIDWSLFKCRDGFLCNGGNKKVTGD